MLKGCASSCLCGQGLGTHGGTAREIPDHRKAAAFSEILLYKRNAIPILRLLPLGLTGGVAEWSKAAVLKTAERKLRGFESLLLRCWLDN